MGQLGSDPVGIQVFAMVGVGVRVEGPISLAIRRKLEAQGFIIRQFGPDTVVFNGLIKKGVPDRGKPIKHLSRESSKQSLRRALEPLVLWSEEGYGIFVFPEVQ